MAKGKNRVVLGCLGLSILAVGFGGWGGWGIYQQLRVRDFLSVEGVVTHSEVVVNRRTDGSSYYPDIHFRYTVGGREYNKGTYHIYQTGTSGRRGKQKIVQQYPVGADVQAWYDPKDPDTAVIDRSFGIFPVIFLVIGLAVLGVIVVICVGHLRGWSLGSSGSGKGM